MCHSVVGLDYRICLGNFLINPIASNYGQARHNFSLKEIYTIFARKGMVGEIEI